MTLEAFKTEVVTIGPVLLPDQNCTLLGSYNGAPLGLKGSGRLGLVFRVRVSRVVAICCLLFLIKILVS